MTDFDIAVVGGGIAGVSAAYELSKTHRVVLAESEAQLAHHSTGRSAAMFIPNYGYGAARPLTVASYRFFSEPPEGLADAPLLSPRGVLWVARPDETSLLPEIARAGEASGSRVIELTPEEAREKVPVLRLERTGGAVWEPDPQELDVAATHQLYVRGLRRNGGTVLTSAPVTSLERSQGKWRVEAGDSVLTCEVVVNAAGAWGDTVASLVGLSPVGLQPLRRTAFMVTGDMDWAAWPMVVSAAHDYYFKPDGPQVLCSPSDETPSEPVDARPDPLDVALAIEKINEATTLEIRSVRSEWAGLRTFAPDRDLVIGPDPEEPTFFWMVGQGGTGIQAAPATAELLAALVRGESVPAHIEAVGVDLEDVSPARPALAEARLASR